MDWKHNLRTNGYHLFPRLASQELVERARLAIDHDIQINYDKSRQSEYDHQSYCPNLRKSPAISDLLIKSPIYNILDEAFGWENIKEFSGGQIAIRQAHNADSSRPPKWHIDGIPSPYNGLKGTKIQNFSALVGVFLTPVNSLYSGNFTVWPCSHHKLEKYFRDRGPVAMNEGFPKIDLLEPPLQLQCQAGDIVLCHYELGHAAAVNISDNDRIAIFFRIWLKNNGEHQWKMLTNIWTGWKI